MNRTHLFFGVLNRMFTYRIPWFHKHNSKGYHSLVPGLNSIFLEMVWVPLNEHSFHLVSIKTLIVFNFTWHRCPAKLQVCLCVWGVGVCVSYKL